MSRSKCPGDICPWGASVRRVHLRGAEGLSCHSIFLITRDRKTREMPKCCILDLMLNGRLQFAVLATLSSWQTIKIPILMKLTVFLSLLSLGIERQGRCQNTAFWLNHQMECWNLSFWLLCCHGKQFISHFHEITAFESYLPNHKRWKDKGDTKIMHSDSTVEWKVGICRRGYSVVMLNQCVNTRSIV